MAVFALRGIARADTANDVLTDADLVVGVMTVPMAEARSEYRDALHAEWLEWFTDLNGPWTPKIAHTHPVARSAPPTTSYAPPPTDVEWMRPTVEAVFGSHTDEALAIIFCESRGVVTAANPTSTARGPWQFLRGWYSGEWSSVVGAFDPYSLEESTAAAWIVSDGGSNWNDWRASRSCHGL